MLEYEIKIDHRYRVRHVHRNTGPVIYDVVVTGFGYKSEMQTVEGYYFKDNIKEPGWWWFDSFCHYFEPSISANKIWKELNA